MTEAEIPNVSTTMQNYGNVTTDNTTQFNFTDGNYTCPTTSTWSNFQHQYSTIHGYISVVICVLGITANLANIIVLSRPKMRSPVNLLLLILALADMLLMVDYMPFAIYFYILGDRTQNTFEWLTIGAAKYLYFYMNIASFLHSVAIWMTIAVATFRWIMLGLTNGRIYTTYRNAIISTAVVVVANMLVNIPNWWSHHITPTPYIDCHDNKTGFTVAWKEDSSFTLWIFSVVGKIIPSIVLTVLTVLLLCIIHKAEKRRQTLLNKGRDEESRRHQEHNRTTGMLLAVVIIFLAIELPHGLFIMCLGLGDNPTLVEVYSALGEVIDTVTLLAFSVNFFLYSAMSRQFRNIFVSLFCKGITSRAASFQRLSNIMSSVKMTVRKKSSNMKPGDDQSVRTVSTTYSAHLNGVSGGNSAECNLLTVSSPLIGNDRATSCTDVTL